MGKGTGISFATVTTAPSIIPKPLPNTTLSDFPEQKNIVQSFNNGLTAVTDTMQNATEVMSNLSKPKMTQTIEISKSTKTFLMILVGAVLGYFILFRKKRK